MLKFVQKQDLVNFTNGWMTSQKDMACVRPDSETLAQMTSGNQFDTIIHMIVEQEGDTVADRVDLL